MLPAYRAILRGDFLEWQGGDFALPQDNGPVAVHVTLLETITSNKQQRGAAMATALEKLAAQNAMKENDDNSYSQNQLG